MKLKYSILAFIILLVSACKNESSSKISKPNEAQETTKYDTLAIGFDNNGKWIANKETHIGVKNMDSIINAIKAEDKNNYKTLGEDLSKQTSYIIKNCNMTGESHDQLHVVLVPMLDEISILKETTDNEERKTSVKNLQILIDLYFKHFKT